MATLLRLHFPLLLWDCLQEQLVIAAVGESRCAGLELDPGGSWGKGHFVDIDPALVVSKEAELDRGFEETGGGQSQEQ